MGGLALVGLGSCRVEPPAEPVVEVPVQESVFVELDAPRLLRRQIVHPLP